MHEIETLEEFNNVLKNNSKVIVDFFSDWCKPCKQIATYFKKLSEKYPDIFFCKINIQNANSDDNEIASLCEISSLPTFLFYKNKVNVDELIGTNETELLNKVNSL